MRLRKDYFDAYGRWPVGNELAQFRKDIPRTGIYDVAAFFGAEKEHVNFIGNLNNPKDGMVKVKLDRQQVFVSEGASFTLPAHTECMVPVAVAKKIKEQEDLYAALADINSPTYDPLEYKRLTGELPKSTSEAVKKWRLFDEQV